MKSTTPQIIRLEVSSQDVIRALEAEVERLRECFDVQLCQTKAETERAQEWVVRHDQLQRKLDWADTMLKAFGEAQEEWVRGKKDLTAEVKQLRETVVELNARIVAMGDDYQPYGYPTDCNNGGSATVAWRER
jgi:uncharacterized coiled-coil DUF342 family protein